MKTIIIFFLILIESLNAQTPLLLLMDDGSAFDTEAQAYFDNLTTPLSDDRQDTINTFVVMLKDSLGIETLGQYFDRLWIFANETSESALKSIVNSTSTNATLVDAPAFAVDRGFTGNGSSSYINTQYNPTADGIAYTQNDASYGVYSRTDSQDDDQELGGKDAASVYSILKLRSTANEVEGRINQAVGTSAVSNSNSSGLILINRPNATTIQYFRNLAQVGTTRNINSTGVPDVTYYIMAWHNGASVSGYSTKQFAFAYMGKSLTTVEVRKLFNCVEWYMDAIGAGVIP